MVIYKANTIFNISGKWGELKSIYLVLQKDILYPSVLGRYKDVPIEGSA
jgi:hypothetical protein